MSKPVIYPLFSTPVYVNNVGDFPRPDIKSLEYSTRTATGAGYNFLSSVDKRVLDRPEFDQVRAVVTNELDRYTRELLAINRRIELYITDSWINIHRRGHTAGPHIHHNSLISGVLYLKVPQNSGDLVFHRELLSLVPFPPALDLDVDSFNIYNCKSWGFKPKTNDICLFPSIVMHSVDPSESDEERWSLAFNLYVRGEFGSLHKVSIK